MCLFRINWWLLLFINLNLNLVFVCVIYFLYYSLLQWWQTASWRLVLTDDGLLLMITNRNLKLFYGFIIAVRTGNYRWLVKTDCSSSNCCSVQATSVNTSFCSEGTYSKARGIGQLLSAVVLFDSFISLKFASSLIENFILDLFLLLSSTIQLTRRWLYCIFPPFFYLEHNQPTINETYKFICFLHYPQSNWNHIIGEYSNG